MKCTSRSAGTLGLIITIVYLSTILCGCGSSKLPLDYKADNAITTTNRVDNRATPFAYNLAVTNDDIAGNNNTTIEKDSAAGLFDVNGKNVLYAKDIHERLYPASLTKIMTALVALKYGNTEDVITCSANVTDLEWGATTCGLKPGDQITLNQALHALLINSSNDAAVAIAEHVGGSIDGFAALMNEEALRLGASNSHFVNPHGLSDNDHYTTVYDLYLITNEAVKYDLFKEIVQMKDYETVFNDSEGNEKTMKFSTTNLFLRGDYSAPEKVTVIGGKTGTTNAAGNCLVLIVKDTSGNPYIGVILRCSERTLINEEMAEILREI